MWSHWTPAESLFQFLCLRFQSVSKTVTFPSSDRKWFISSCVCQCCSSVTHDLSFPGNILMFRSPGEREDHWSGVQEPAVLAETEGGERRSGWDWDDTHTHTHTQKQHCYWLLLTVVNNHWNGQSFDPTCRPLQVCGGTAGLDWKKYEHINYFLSDWFLITDWSLIKKTSDIKPLFSSSTDLLTVFMWKKHYDGK